MNLVEKALSYKINKKQTRNNYSEEEWKLAKTFLIGGITTRQVVHALGRENSPQVVYPWVLEQLRGAIKEGRIIFK